jgi:uncharacterized protein
MKSQLNWLWRQSLMILVLLPFSFSAFSVLASPEIPELRGPVMDEVRLLSADENARLEQRIRDIFQNGGPQIQFWSFPSLEGDDIAPVAIRAAEKWKIGRQGTDDGVLFLIALRERRTRLEVGKGLEGAIPDVMAGRLLRDVLRPSLRAGKPYEGIVGVVAAIDSLAKGQSPELPQETSLRGAGKNAEQGEGGILKIFLIVLFLVFVVIQPFLALLGLGGLRRRHLSGVFGWGGGGWTRGGGGGGWSGGGGGFSGGGSSGDW